MLRESLEFRIRLMLGAVMAGLILSGAAVFLLESTFDLLGRLFGAGTALQAAGADSLAGWVLMVRNAIRETNSQYPFLAYATDWLAFAHFIIAAAFIGALRNPARNIWVITWGMAACLAVFPTAFIAGQIRGIPLSWQLFSCSFGFLAFFPLWLCRVYAVRLERLEAEETERLNS